MLKQVKISMLFSFIMTLVGCPYAFGNTLNTSYVGIIDLNLNQGNVENILFRGDIPLDAENNFSQAALVSEMEAQYKEFQGLHSINSIPFTQIPFPQKYIVLDISFISTKNSQEGPQLAAEFNQITQKEGNPIAHTDYSGVVNTNFEWWQIMLPYKNYIPGIKPEDVIINPLDDSGQMINVPQLIQQLHTLLTTKSSEPLLIYIHCENGEDRTGLVTMAYRLTYGGYSINQETRINQYVDYNSAMYDTTYPNKDAKRSPINYSRTSAEYYCQYLNAQGSHFNCPNS